MPIPNVPASGPIVLSDGRELPAMTLRELVAYRFRVRGDGPSELRTIHEETRDRILATMETMRGCRDVLRNIAVRDGFVLCVRTTAMWSGRFGITLEEADDLLCAGSAQLVVVDPYDADGEPIVVDGVDLCTFAADRVGKVAA